MLQFNLPVFGKEWQNAFVRISNKMLDLKFRVLARSRRTYRTPRRFIKACRASNYKEFLSGFRMYSRGPCFKSRRGNFPFCIGNSGPPFSLFQHQRDQSAGPGRRTAARFPFQMQKLQLQRPRPFRSGPQALFSEFRESGTNSYPLSR